MDRFLESLGTAQEGGEFSLNQERATQFLSEAWASQRPRAVYPVHLLASAVSSGATRFRYSKRPSPLVFLKNLLFQDRWQFFAEHDGEPPPPEELDRLAQSLWQECRPSVRYLALACQLAQSLYKSRVSVEACRGTTRDQLVVKNGVWDFTPGLRLAQPFEGLRFRAEFGQRSFRELFLLVPAFDPDEESRALDYCGRWAPLQMPSRLKRRPTQKVVGAYWHESGASAIFTEMDARPSPHDFSLLIEVRGEQGAEEGWVFLRHGVVLGEAASYEERAATIEGVLFVVSSSRFGVDASARAVVKDEYFDSVVTRCLEMLGSLLLEVDLENSEHSATIRHLMMERELVVHCPALYELPVFETVEGEFLGATQARLLATNSPGAFSPWRLEELRWVWDWDLPDYAFGQGFPQTAKVEGAGRYLLCLTGDGAVRGVFDQERQEFRSFQRARQVLLPGTSILVQCTAVGVLANDLEGKGDFDVSLGDEWSPHPLVGATLELGLVLDRGYLHKWDIARRESVGKSPLEGEFQRMEFWRDSVVLLRGEKEWGLYDAEKDIWLLREPSSVAGFQRRVHLEQGGSLTVEEFPEQGVEGEFTVRVYSLDRGSLSAQATTWEEWAGAHQSVLSQFSPGGRLLGEAPGVVYVRDRGCLWSMGAEADSEPRMLARNDGLKSLFLHSDYLVWATEQGCSVFCRASERIRFYQDTLLRQNCLLRLDKSGLMGFELLHPLTGEVTTKVSRAVGFGRPDHLSLWAHEEELVLCEPWSGRVLNSCPYQSGEYWLNEKWSLRYTTGQWTRRAADGNRWERVSFPPLEEHRGVTLLEGFVLFEKDSEVLVYAVSGEPVLTLRGGLLTCSHLAYSIAVLDRDILRLIDLPAVQMLEFPEEIDWDLSMGGPRFWDGRWFAHPWAGILRRGPDGWDLDIAAYRSWWWSKNQGKLSYDWDLGTAVFGDVYTGRELARFHADGSDWFFFTPLGLYDCSADGEELLLSDIDRSSIQRFKRKGLMGEILRYRWAGPRSSP